MVVEIMIRLEKILSNQMENGIDFYTLADLKAIIVLL
jgi:hypothetical protein